LERNLHPSRKIPKSDTLDAQYLPRPLLAEFMDPRTTVATT